MAIKPPLMSSSVKLITSLSPRATCAAHAPAKQSACCSLRIVGSLELVGAGLHGVAELVGQHHGDRRLPEIVDELRQQLGVVVDHEVAVDAVEGVALHVEVRGLRCAASRDRFGSLRVRGVDAAGKGGELAAVERRELLRPERLDVAERGGEVAVVAAAGLLAPKSMIPCWIGIGVVSTVVSTVVSSGLLLSMRLPSSF